jgi:hypothetical protein
MPRKNDGISTSGIVEDNDNNLAATAVERPGSTLNHQDSRISNRRRTDMGLHGQPFNRGRRDSDKKK